MQPNDNPLPAPLAVLLGAISFVLIVAVVVFAAFALGA